MKKIGTLKKKARINSTDERAAEKIDLFFNSRLAIWLQVTSYTIGTMAIIIGGGYLLDKYIGSFPKIFILSLVLAFPVVQIVLFKKMRTFAGKRLEGRPKSNRNPKTKPKKHKDI